MGTIPRADRVSTRNRECKSRARARLEEQPADCHSRCIAHVPRYARGKTHEETYICARRKVSITSRDTLLHLRLFSHLPHHLVADAPRSTRRQASFRHRHNAMHNCSSQKECIDLSMSGLMQLISLILKNYCARGNFL